MLFLLSLFPALFADAVSVNANKYETDGVSRVGTSEEDTLTGGAGSDDILGLLGADFLNGGAGDDVMQGGFGDDTLNGDAGAEIIQGEAGFDRINGNADNDLLQGRGCTEDELFLLVDATASNPAPIVAVETDGYDANIIVEGALLAQVTGGAGLTAD